MKLGQLSVLAAYYGSHEYNRPYPRSRREEERERKRERERERERGRGRERIAANSTER